MCEVLVPVIFLALAFDFINGFHDTANAVATSLATGALTSRSAILLATTMNFLGALTFTGVALTMAGGIVDTATLSNNPKTITAALLAAVVWNLLTWLGGLPSSSSHALVGALTGAALAAAGLKGVNLPGLVTIFQALVLSPLLAVTTGFTVMAVLLLLTGGQTNPRLSRCFRYWQRVAAALQAFSHGTNDAQKTMGVITLTLVLTGYQESLVVPLWAKVLSALSLALGTSCGGWRIIHTVGEGITRLDPPAGFAADTGSALVIFTATLLGLPVSTTHVISSSITGVGLTRGAKAVSWSTIGRILLAWVLTLPVTAVLGALFYIL
ncbi:anion permease [Desulfofundulus sp.]|uniref:inorganic phosphate transporter n=1 Tax=Desulfofundulus sp. TaxID=2282750 RepID=UPI003C740B19